MIKTVIKRNGISEPFSPEKLNKLSRWATEVVSKQEEEIDWSALALEATKKLHDRCSTKDIVKAFIQACLDRQKEGYLFVAGKLLVSDLYKDTYVSEVPPSLYDHIETMLELDLYEDFISIYSEEELQELDEIIDHTKDFTLSHPQVNQMMSKYLIKNVLTEKIYETPQFMFMRVALSICENEIDRLEKIKLLYNYFSNFNINLPTPMWVNLGTPNKVGTSCLLYTVDDTIGSLNAGDNIAYMMTIAGAGIGNIIFTRSKNTPINSGRLKHSGKLPYFRLLESIVAAAYQNNSGRGGAATTYLNCLDPEIMTMLHLKNATSIPEEKIDGIDYAFSFNDFFLQQAKTNKEWMLIDYSVAPDLYQAMYGKDQNKFIELYNKYLNDKTVNKKIIKAMDLAIKYLDESHNSGRLYEFNATNANIHTAYKDPIYSSNLCNEIYLPTKAFKHRKELEKTTYEEGDGWVQTCNLAAINLNKNYSDEEYSNLCYWTLKIIDHVIDSSHYILPQVGVTTKAWRSAGVSIINLAHHLAKNNYNYSSISSKKYMHFLFERHEYMLLNASLEIAKERGNAPWIHKTKYPEGYLPIDDYNKNVDTIADFEYKYDWEDLRTKIIKNKGIAHSALSTAVPSESSSILSNSTNGLYPARREVIIKTGATTKNILITPESSYLTYQYAWDVPHLDMVHTYAIAQKFISQGISADYYMDLTKDKDKSLKNLFNLMLARNHFGHKGKYYTNLLTQQKTSEQTEQGCAGGSCTL